MDKTVEKPIAPASGSSMRYQDQIVRCTQKALDDVCRAAIAVPKDKHGWHAMGSMRSVLDQMQEIATTAPYFLPLIRSGVAPAFDEEATKKAVRERAQFNSVDLCVAEARRTVAELCQTLSEVPDHTLEREVIVPFGGDVTWTLADAMAGSYWNFVYHFGQINQIQLMLGDKEMH